MLRKVRTGGVTAVAPDQSLDLSLNPSLVLLQGHQPQVAHRKGHKLVTTACLTSPFGCTRSHIVPGACYGRFLGSGMTSDASSFGTLGEQCWVKRVEDSLKLARRRLLGIKMEDYKSVRSLCLAELHNVSALAYRRR